MKEFEKSAEVVRTIDKGKDTGTNNFKFNENVKNHLKNVENVNTKKSVIGGHNLDEFNNALKNQGVGLDE